FLGAIANCEDESEFAGVVAHELGHNSHDHVGQTIGRQQRARDVLGLGGLLGRPGRAIGGIVGGWAAGIRLQRYSRDQEIEADERAIEYTVRAAIDPDGLARWFARLHQQYGSQGIALFQSHPSHRNRVSGIRKTIAGYEVPPNAHRDSESFRRARDRAREILPYYLALHQALAQPKPKPVVEACDAGMAALPHHGQFYFWKGLLIGAIDDDAARTEALILLRKAALLDPSNHLTHVLRAMSELSAGQFRSAVAAATDAIALVPLIASPYLVRGLARLPLGEKKAAFQDFDTALGHVPEDQREELIGEIRRFAPDYRT
ncbi:MAG: M48 family metalloprotease, partial [Planctomycetota bacterium]|nr:M48 family metalloprotease [Planctomycetota bacterium]